MGTSILGGARVCNIKKDYNSVLVAITANCEIIFYILYTSDPVNKNKKESRVYRVFMLCVIA